MPKRSLLPETVERYVDELATGAREASWARSLREETARLPEGGMQIGPDQGAFLALLVRAIGARRAIEVGTFTGYSALRVAQALPAGGRLVCCDVSREWTSIAQRFWRDAGVDDRIELRLAPAGDTLALLMRDPGPASFDFAFVDADKTGYDGYYEQCLTLVRAGGLIAFDNMLWGGQVADPDSDDPEARALRALNAKAHADPRVDACLLTVGDGVLLVRKR